MAAGRGWLVTSVRPLRKRQTLCRLLRTGTAKIVDLGERRPQARCHPLSVTRFLALWFVAMADDLMIRGAITKRRYWEHREGNQLLVAGDGHVAITSSGYVLFLWAIGIACETAMNCTGKPLKMATRSHHVPANVDKCTARVLSIHSLKSCKACWQNELMFALTRQACCV